MQQKNRNQQLARMTGQVAADLAERRATIGRLGDGPSLGDPEYQRWREATLRPAARELDTPPPVLPFRRFVRRAAAPVALAASVVLAVWLATTTQEVDRLEDALDAEQQRTEQIAASRAELAERLDASQASAERLDAALRQLRESSDAALAELRAAMRRELAEIAQPHLLPFFELQGIERQRSSHGQPVVLEVDRDARALALALEVADPELYLRAARADTEPLQPDLDNARRRGYPETMETARRIVYVALILALASTGCGLAEACAEMMAAGDCCCEGMAGMPCREMSGGTQDDPAPRPDGALRSGDNAPSAILGQSDAAVAALPIPCTIEGPRSFTAGKPQALFLAHCAFLC